MPRIRSTRATYVPHANGWTVRPTVRGKRYFIGYWPTEADALREVAAFKSRAEYTFTDEDMEAAARELQTNAKENNEIRRRHERSEIKKPHFTLSTRVESIEQRLERIEDILKGTR